MGRKKNLQQILERFPFGTMYKALDKSDPPSGTSWLIIHEFRSDVDQSKWEHVPSISKWLKKSNRSAGGLFPRRPGGKCLKHILLSKEPYPK